jgi:hypothetical protein
MSDPNTGFNAAVPSPASQAGQPTRPSGAPRPTYLRLPAIVIAAIGLLIAIAGLIKILPGGIVTGVMFVFWGIVLFAFSFIPLPEVTAAEEPPLSGLQKVIGMFYEPTRVFKNLRVHPRWLAALLVLATMSGIYYAAFVQRLTPERIVDFTMEKLADSPIKPPPDKMEQAKENSLQQTKQPIQRIQTFVKGYFNWFFVCSIISALLMLAVIAFGGRINFWQAFAGTMYAYLPVTVITKLVSLIILYVKSPDDIHPILNAETLVQDNLGVLFTPATQPVLFVLGSSLGILVFYGLWLRAKGLMNTGTKVSSTAAWSVTLMFWVLGLLIGMVFASLFSSFMS